jgi:hypothetical protein
VRGEVTSVQQEEVMVGGGLCLRGRDGGCQLGLELD